MMSKDEALAPKDIAAYELGYEDGQDSAIAGEPLGIPIGQSEDYEFGFTVGWADARWFLDGMEAAQKGICTPPAEDPECPAILTLWRQGYEAAFTNDLMRCGANGVLQ